MIGTTRARLRLSMASALAAGFLMLTVVLPITLDVCAENHSVTQSIAAEDVETVTVTDAKCKDFQPTSAAVVLTGLGALLLAAPFLLRLIPPGLDVEFLGIRVRTFDPTTILAAVEENIARNTAD